jgi:hypothetical protein
MAKIYPTKARDGGATCRACGNQVPAGQPILKVSEAAGVVKLYCDPCGKKAAQAVADAATGLMVSALESLEPRPAAEPVAIADCLQAAFDAAWEV